MEERAEAAWAELGELAAGLANRLVALAKGGADDGIMDPAALSAAEKVHRLVLRVLRTADDDRPVYYVLDPDALNLVAWFHYARVSRLGGQDSAEVRDEVTLTLDLFALIQRFLPGQVPDDVRPIVADTRIPPLKVVPELADRTLALHQTLPLDGSIEAVDEVIAGWREILLVLPERHPSLPMLTSNLGTVLRDRYELLGEDDDLEESVDLGRWAVRSAAHDDPDRSMYLSNLSAALIHRYFADESPAVLDEAVRSGTEAVSIAPVPHPHYHSNAGMALLHRALRDDATADLDLAADAFRAALGVAEADNPSRAKYLMNLGLALHTKYRAGGEPSDLDSAFAALDQAVTTCPPTSADRVLCLAHSAHVLVSKARRSWTAEDQEAAVDTARAALAAAPRGGPHRLLCLRVLGESLMCRFERDGDLAVLEEAAGLLELSLGHSGEAQARTTLVKLGEIHLFRYDHTADPEHLDAAIAVLRPGLPTAPHERFERAAMLTLLGRVLGIRFEYTASPSDVEEALTVLEEARELISDDHTEAMAECMSALGGVHVARFERSASTADFEVALLAVQEAVRFGDESEGTLIAHLLMKRFSLHGDQDDLAESLTWQRRALGSLREGDPNRPYALVGLGRALSTGYVRSGDLAGLDEAVDSLEEADRSPRLPMRTRAQAKYHLSSVLRTRAERLGSRADLDRAVELDRQAVALASPADPERAVYLSHLGATQSIRHVWTGNPSDLDEAVRAAVRAVEATTEATPAATRVMVQSNLSLTLRLRYERSNALADLEQAIEAGRAAVRETPPGDMRRAHLLDLLAVVVRARFKRSRDLSDLREAITLSRAAVEAVSDTDPQGHMYAGALGNVLDVMRQLTGDPAFGEQAVRWHREAVRRCPDGHPQQGLTLSNLSGALLTRRGRSPDPADVDEAIRTAEAALRCVAGGLGERAAYMMNLGRAFRFRWSLNGRRRDFDAAIDLLGRASRVDEAQAATKFHAALLWAEMSIQGGEWEDALDAHRAAIGELTVLAWHGLDRDDRLHALSDASGLARSAAAVALNAGKPEEALRLLEQARGVLLAQALDGRDEMTNLTEHAPELAERIRRVQTAIGADVDVPVVEPGGATAVTETWRQWSAAERRRELAAEMDELVRRVRALPGFEDFRRPPSIDRLREAAEHGPVVVVNVSRVRSDAFIVTRDGLRTVPLPDLALDGADGLDDRTRKLLDALAGVGRSPADTWRAQRVLGRTLGWLWDVVVAPVLDVLEPGPVVDGSPPRLWWCPTGPLSLLPLHAAGHYGPEADGPVLPDLYTCSYTPTLRALVARPARVIVDGLLAVDLSDTPGLTPLPHARDEVRTLTGRVPVSTLLAGPDAGRAAVLGALPKHAMFHFAGHGGQDANDPASGALYCHDHEESGPLAVRDIAGLRLERARLAFLSACDTARGVISLSDEGIHLTGAMQLAGFTHVVAAQWTVRDADALLVADDFYTALDLDPSRAATALHGAVRRLRERVGEPLYWAPYVHTGP